MEIPVLITDIVDNSKSVNDYINDGLISTVSKSEFQIIIKIPMIFLYHVWKPAIIPIIKLFESPTHVLSLEETEKFDCNALLLKMFGIARLFPHKEYHSLSFFPNLKNQYTLVPLSTTATHYYPIKATHQISSKNFLKYMQEYMDNSSNKTRPFIPVINANMDKFADWFIYWPNAQDIPEMLTKDWHGNTQVLETKTIIPSGPFVICGQSKRYYKTELTSTMIYEEYDKV